MKKLLGLMLCLLLALGLTCALADDEPTEYTSGDYEYILLEDGTAEIVKYNGMEADLTIPAQLDGHSVSSIGMDVFYQSSSLVTVTVPEGVVSIGEFAFAFCKALTEVTLPEGVTTIGRHAFTYCGQLTTVTLPDTLTDIGNSAFHFCPKLETIALPEGVLSIGVTAFSSCRNLKSLHLPACVTSIGVGAFSDCPNLTLTVPRDSYAEQYCIDNGLDYTYPDANDWLLN